MGSSDDHRDRSRGALIGSFVGDALGMPFEGQPPAAIPTRVEMEDARLGRGTYTDDTEMMIALAESLLRCEVVDEEDLARSFLAAYDARRGYGGGTRRVFEHWRKGVPAGEASVRVFEGRGSLGNGAAMRIAPLAVRFAEEEALLEVQSRRSARLTHAHPVGIDGAAVQAAAIAAALRGDEPLRAARTSARTAELCQALDRAAALMASHPAPAELAAVIGSSSAAHESVPAAIYAATVAETFEQAVSYAVRCGGDTDTVGAMCGAIAGARHGYASIPERWIGVLEQGERGRVHVERLALSLAERARRPNTGPLGRPG